jgi:hypothetical protein
MNIDASIVYESGEMIHGSVRVFPASMSTLRSGKAAEEPIVVLRVNDASIVLGLDQACEMATVLLLAAKQMSHEPSTLLVDLMIRFGQAIKTARESGQN